MKKALTFALIVLLALSAVGFGMIRRASESDGSDAMIFGDGNKLYFGTDQDAAVFYYATGTTVELDGTFSVGLNGTGYDVTLFGDTAGQKFFWDQSADTAFLTCTVDIDGTVTVGADTAGFDVKFFGSTTGKYFLWDESADTAEVSGTLKTTDDLGLLLKSTSATWDPASLADGAQESKDFTVTGAALGDFALAGAGVDVTDILVSCVVTAADTVTVTLANETGGTVDLASSTWYVTVIQSH